MAGLADIVNVNITRSTRTVSLPGFGTALFLGPNATGLNVCKSMTDVAALFSSSQAEYLAAQAYFGQINKPASLLIGKRTSAIAQVVTYTPTAINTQLYSVSINGVVYTFTSSGSATATNIVTGLKAAITDTTVTTSGTTTLIVTANVAGTPFIYNLGLDVNIAAVVTTASNGVIEDILAADFAARTAGFSWYMLGLASRLQADIQNAAQQIESMFKMFIGCSSDAGILVGATTTDVASVLKSKAYLRTALLYSAGQATFPEMAWMGGVLPLNAGSETWKFKGLIGSVPDDQLSATQFTTLQAKNCNYYYTIAGVPITSAGEVCGGATSFIDVTRFVDWYSITMQGQVFTRLANLPKVPYTDEGFSQIEADIRAVNQQAERVGGLAKGSSFVVVPTVASEVSGDKSSRNANNFQFGGTLAGAIHSVVINGFLST
jgi:hypothetical protein